MEAMATERLRRTLRSAAADAAGDAAAEAELRALAARVEAEAARDGASASLAHGRVEAEPLERLRAAVVARWLRSPRPPSPAEAARVLAAF
ncbi:MAG TPA: hypothetical protein VF771_18195, partial [Longimicrobiaceae bacterium]